MSGKATKTDVSHSEINHRTHLRAGKPSNKIFGYMWGKHYSPASQTGSDAVVVWPGEFFSSTHHYTKIVLEWFASQINIDLYTCLEQATHETWQ